MILSGQLQIDANSLQFFSGQLQNSMMSYLEKSVTALEDICLIIKEEINEQDV